MKRPALTAEGALAAGAVGIAAGVAAVGGSNALAFVAAAGLSAWALAFGAGAVNLRGLTLRRDLPQEVFAGVDAPGLIVLVNTGRFAASSFRVLDGTATARIDGVGPGVERRAPVAWRFLRRGEVVLDGVILTSEFPFGWLRWERVVASRADVTVYPRPEAGRSQAAKDREADEVAGFGRGRTDWVGIRPWRDGDSERQVHWPSSARLGDWMVVERSGAGEQAVEVILDPTLPRERALSVAAWEVITAAGAVGLLLENQRFPPQLGRAWRRVLLDALARAEARP